METLDDAGIVLSSPKMGIIKMTNNSCGPSLSWPVPYIKKVLRKWSYLREF
jgi:hypothetical protein